MPTAESLGYSHGYDAALEQVSLEKYRVGFEKGYQAGLEKIAEYERQVNG